jgi:hypothetical protein
LNSLFIPGLLQGLVSGANSQLRNTYSGDIIVESNTARPLLSDANDTVNKIKAIDGVVGLPESTHQCNNLRSAT